MDCSGIICFFLFERGGGYKNLKMWILKKNNLILFFNVFLNIILLYCDLKLIVNN